MAGATAGRAAIGVGGLIVAGVIFVAVNILADRGLNTVRVDLTEEKLYTVSEGTEQVLADLQEPVHLRLYFSERFGRLVPSYGNFATRVQDLLREYDQLGGSKIQLSIIDPEPFTEEEDKAVGFGLRGLPLDESGTPVYFGLVGTNALDDLKAIPFFQPERENLLEYDLTRLVYTLSNPKKPVLGLLTSIPIQGSMTITPSGQRRTTEAWVVYEQLQTLFEIRELEAPLKAIDDDIDVLMIVQPKDVGNKALDPGSLYAIDQYVLGGGRAMVFLDPHSERETQYQQGPRHVRLPTYSNLRPLLESWGIAYDPDRFVGDKLAARMVRVQEGARTRATAVSYLAWLHLRERNLNSEDLLTAEIKNIGMHSTGAVTPTENATTTMEPLIFSNLGAALMDAEEIRAEPRPTEIMASYNALAAEGKIGTESYPLAARVMGPAKTAYPDGRPPEPEKKSDAGDATSESGKDEPESGKPHLAESKGDIHLIVVADTDILGDGTWLRINNFLGQRMVVPEAGNGSFVVNAAEQLAGSEGLITLRSRGISSRPFERIERMEREAQTQFRATERELVDKLEEAERKLRELRAGDGEGGAIMTAEQQAEVEKFRKEILTIRRELRDVQHNLNRDVDTLQDQIKALNIGAMPLAVMLLAVLVGLFRMLRRRQASPA